MIEIAFNFGANEEANLRVDKGQIYGYIFSQEKKKKKKKRLISFPLNGFKN